MTETEGYIVRTERHRSNIVWVTEYSRHKSIRRAIAHAKALAKLIPAEYVATVTPQRSFPSVVDSQLFWQDAVGEEPLVFPGQMDADR